MEDSFLSILLLPSILYPLPSPTPYFLLLTSLFNITYEENHDQAYHH